MVNSIHNVPSAMTATSRTAALDRLLTLSGRLTEVMDQGMSGRGLSRPQATLLMVLHHNGPTVQRGLSQALGVTPRHVTGLVDALEADGWVERRPHPTDRRASMVTLTEQGEAAVATMNGDRQGWAEQLFADVPESDLAAFIAILDTLDKAVPRRNDDPQCGG